MKSTIYTIIFCFVMLFVGPNLSMAKIMEPEDVLITEASQETDVQLAIGGSFFSSEADFSKIKFVYLEFRNSGKGGSLDRVAPSLDPNALMIKLLSLGINVTTDEGTLSKDESSAKIEVSVTPITRNAVSWLDQRPGRKISKMAIKILDTNGAVISMTSVNYTGLGRSAKLIPGDAYLYLKARLFPNSILRR